MMADEDIQCLPFVFLGITREEILSLSLPFPA